MIMKRFIAALAVLSIIQGCGSPPEARWNEEAPAIGPVREAGRGYLSVVENDPLAFTSPGPRLKLAPFALYDDREGYVTKNADPAPHVPPVSLKAGRYVVAASVQGKERRIRVLIEEGRLTRVNLSALQPEPAAPEVPPPGVRP